MSKKNIEMELFWKIMSKFGSKTLYLIISIVICLINLMLGIQLILGFIFMHVLAIPIRYYKFKKRPKKISYKNQWERIKAGSFPSLHASRSIYLMIVLLPLFYEKMILFYLIFTLVSLVLLSRIKLLMHDMKDVAGGFTLALCTYLFIIGILMYF